MNNYEFCAAWAAQQGGRILDYGCGAGQIVALLRARGIDAWGCDVFYEGGDYSPHILPEARPYVVRMDGPIIPFDDDSFDVVVSNQVLEHVHDLDGVLREIARVLRPGGRALHLFPDRGVWREGHCGIPFLHRLPDPVRVYYAAALRALGCGYHHAGKPVMQWAQDFCAWLDQWTHYRPLGEIHETVRRHFREFSHLEDHWLASRLGYRVPLPAAIQRWIVRKLAGMAIITRNPAKNRSDRAQSGRRSTPSPAALDPRS